MIKYNLKCAEGHRFDSWFQDSAAYDKLSEAGHLTCAVCGSGAVEKAIMAPSVNLPETPPLSAPPSPAEQAMREIRTKFEDTAEHVGDRFATEARAIHVGEKPDRMIYGEARPEEVRGLLEDGVPVAPLPWPADKSN